MNVAKIIALTRELNTMNTLLARKNIVEIKKFKKIIIFKIIFERKKKILKSTIFDIQYYCKSLRDLARFLCFAF